MFINNFNLNVDVKKVLEMGENYFPEIKKMKEEKEKEELKKWAQELNLKKLHKNRLKEIKPIKIKAKKAIPPAVKMAYALYKTIVQTLQKDICYENEKYVISTMVPMYKVPSAEDILKTEKEIKEKTVTPVQEGVTLSLIDEDDMLDFTTGIPNLNINEQKKDYQETFKKVIEEKTKKERVEKQQIENPFLDNESIFGDFRPPLKNENSKEKEEAIKFAEKLFAS